ncbi:hypothetical protein NG99_13975 [Erwinia typographi]|uniref:Primosomal protein N' (Replication factor Y)-superfamily II helicase n=1 Tax=Erwinia typographi TaxID=371042 RepID=A0A0A3Z4F2_9GAMM|nr:zinc ribbon domain-containing protein [Erwinia typographi]KGT92496.1 hypothetical protein NG99_13975 [Erwinia typographi]
MRQRCPQCQQELIADEANLYCPHCEPSVARQAICPDCKQPLQVLKACGAVDYFCQHGHGLISKKRVEFSPLAHS